MTCARPSLQIPTRAEDNKTIFRGGGHQQENMAKNVTPFSTAQPQYLTMPRVLRGAGSSEVFFFMYYLTQTSSKTCWMSETEMYYYDKLVESVKKRENGPVLSEEKTPARKGATSDCQRDKTGLSSKGYTSKAQVAPITNSK